MSQMPQTDSGPKGRTRVGLFSRKAERPPAAAPEPPKRPKRPRRQGFGSLSGILSFLLIGAVVGLGAFVYAVIQAVKTGPLTEDKVVVIGREEDSGTIGEQLEKAGVIDSATWFSLITLVDGFRSQLKRGEYDFKAGETLRQVEEQLASGRVVQHALTVPEGLTSDQIAQRLRDNDLLLGEIREPPREGSILPETYFFVRSASRAAVLKRMQDAQTKLVADIWSKRAPDLPIKSPGELVTLASIVEKETGKPDERAHIAGVFMNRLNRHMKLQSDPTIVYGLVFGKGTLGHSITKAELDQPTPYNTYIIDGLPPGPIANPGKAALEAVANPLKTRDLYFVADGTGGHAFAETLEQHLKNVAKWRQIQQDAKDRLGPDVTPTPASAAPPTVHGETKPGDEKPLGMIPSFALDRSTGQPSALAQALGRSAFAMNETTSGPYAKLWAPPLPAPPSKPSALDHALAKLADRVRSREALLGPDGALTSHHTEGQTLADLGVVVPGVNDDDDVPMASDAQAGKPQADSPRPDLFDVGGTPAQAAEPVMTAQADNGAMLGRHRVFDASEGTPLDPLLNKSWDLNYPHTVPSLQ